MFAWSTFVARRAGRYPAITVTNTMAAVATAMMAGSKALRQANDRASREKKVDSLATNLSRAMDWSICELSVATFRTGILLSIRASGRRLSRRRHFLISTVTTSNGLLLTFSSVCVSGVPQTTSPALCFDTSTLPVESLLRKS
jgi:hypothetical protein